MSEYNERNSYDLLNVKTLVLVTNPTKNNQGYSFKKYERKERKEGRKKSRKERKKLLIQESKKSFIYKESKKVCFLCLMVYQPL